MIDLLEPYIQPCVDDLLDDVESGRTWTLAHVPEAILKLLRDMNTVAPLVPESFFEVSPFAFHLFLYQAISCHFFSYAIT